MIYQIELSDDKKVGDVTTGVVQYSKLKAQLDDGSKAQINDGKYDRRVGDSTTGVVQYFRLKAQLNDGSMIGAWYKMMVLLEARVICQSY